MEEDKPIQELTEEKSKEMVSNLLRQEYHKAMRDLFIGGVILLVVWIVLSSVLPEGWIMAIVNISCMIASIIWGWYLSMALKIVLPGWLSVLLSVLVWALLFLVIRSLT